ncbi:MAG: transposase, partial [Candidatus Binatia bacterium]
MARKSRVEFEGAFYHVIVRGNQRQKIFKDERDRLSYLERVEHYRERYGFTLYAYVLMSNHVHLLLETGRVTLSKIMQGIQFSYTQLYNRRHRTVVGHLFEGRYKAILCDRNQYLLELVRYIHLNPARMRSAFDPWRYRWSSHRAYLGERRPVTVEVEPVLGQMGKRVGQARRTYLQFMQDGLGSGHEEKYYQTTDQRFLGDEAFVEEVASKAKDTAIRPNGSRVSFDRLLEVVCKEHGLAEQTLIGFGRRNDWVQARRQLVYLGREWARMTTQELGERLKRDPSMMSRLYKEYAENRDLGREAILVRTL